MLSALSTRGVGWSAPVTSHRRQRRESHDISERLRQVGRRGDAQPRALRLECFIRQSKVGGFKPPSPGERSRSVDFRLTPADSSSRFCRVFHRASLLANERLVPIQPRAPRTPDHAPLLHLRWTVSSSSVTIRSIPYLPRGLDSEIASARHRSTTKATGAEAVRGARESPAALLFSVVLRTSTSVRQ